MAKSKKRGDKTNNKTIKQTKFINCSPLVKDKTPIANSCYTKSALLYLKKIYNEYHPFDRIQSITPTELWNEINNKFTHCNKEDCWLDQIKDYNIRVKMDKLLFAPDSPKDWKINPKRWLSNFDIFNVLHQYEIKYPYFKALKPTPIDFDVKLISYGGCVNEELCNFDIEKYLKMKKTKFGIVYNLDKHNQKGSHWVSMFIDLDDKFIFFMDSGGDTAPPEIKTFTDRVMNQLTLLNNSIKLTYYENSPLEHQYGNTECGMYSLFFIITMLTNEVENKSFKTLKQKINLFMKKRIPDKYIFNYRKQYFNI